MNTAIEEGCRQYGPDYAFAAQAAGGKQHLGARVPAFVDRGGKEGISTRDRGNAGGGLVFE